MEIYLFVSENTFALEIFQPLFLCKEICQLCLIIQPIKTIKLDISLNYVLTVLLTSILSNNRSNLELFARF